ncbi:MAG TPA: PHB depolymerase family esterase [Noviherbaspirillum sp.]|uniref:extracellular catalytic domain type 1 short-chain-length polyhydroxyalkanoate depolymerase n=1 Tax=Noviherbaspirillum sp. TaxID=1926288 RepID=UPI002B48EB18|nr:PHB depolymerase family esterase [Noviherbaspirillum sp.]HJV84249.1 PHB depolymerase family esterase [Noviherbaspirillum sp.]
MKLHEEFLAQMREAARILQKDGPVAATTAIQRALHGSTAQDSTADWTRFLPQAPELHDINSPTATGVETSAGKHDGLRSRINKWTAAMTQQAVEDVEIKEAEDLAGKGRFITGNSTNHAGTRTWKLYIPSAYTGQSLPLVVMLHGCTQNPDDFAAGTGMNMVAEDKHCFVLYPGQAKEANASHCWNWFNPVDQRRDSGEASIIADMTRQVIREYAIDTRRVYVAGLSAGGAMAAVMGASYPDLYAAIGVHSGLPHGVAHNLPSAFAAMKNRKAKGPAMKAGAKEAVPFKQSVPVIVFHGDRDTTVNPSNADQVLSQCVSSTTVASKIEGGDGGRIEAGGRPYTRTLHTDAEGNVVAEKWIVRGAGHAWSGGSRKGSYTDPEGPDAAREMLRFFYTHERKAR